MFYTVGSKQGPNSGYVRALVVRGTNSFARTLGSGLWWSRLSGIIMSAQQISNDIQVIFSLDQNYPNFFNPTTTISWRVPVGSWQTLKIYDVLGNEIAILIDEYKLAGSYEVVFNGYSEEGQNLSSGVYFYRLQAGEITDSKRLLLIK